MTNDSISMLPRIALLLLCTSLVFGAASTYEEKKDDFSNAVMKSVTLTSLDGPKHLLFLTRQSDGTISVQFATTEVIFPNGLSKDIGKGMEVSVTMKVDSADAATTTMWHMAPAKYNNAWFQGDAKKLLAEAIGGKVLALRLDRNATVVKFDVDEARANLVKLVDPVPAPGK